MKKDLLIILVSAFCGFLVCLLIIQKPQNQFTINIPVEILDSLSQIITRQIMDSLPDYIPIITPQGIDSIYIDSTTKLVDVPLREYEAIDSIPILIDGKIEYPNFRLVFGYKGLAEYYKIQPITLTTIFHKASTPKTSQFSGGLSAGFMINHNLEFDKTELNGILFYKRFGVNGRMEIAPVEDYLQFKGLIGLKIKIL